MRGPPSLAAATVPVTPWCYGSRMAVAWATLGVLAAMSVTFFVYLGTKVDGLGARIDGLGGRIDGLGGRIDALAAKVDAQGGRIDGLAAAVTAQGRELGVRIDGLAARLDAHITGERPAG